MAIPLPNKMSLFGLYCVPTRPETHAPTINPAEPSANKNPATLASIAYASIKTSMLPDNQTNIDAYMNRFVAQFKANKGLGVSLTYNRKMFLNSSLAGALLGRDSLRNEKISIMQMSA